MNTSIQLNRNLFQTHWFFIAAIIILSVDIFVVLFDGWQNPNILEAGLLFDFAALIPLLYLLCYRAKGKRAITRVVALTCLGIWAAGHIVPESNHNLLLKLGFLRYVGLAVLIVLEVKLVAAIYRAAFNTETSPKKGIAKTVADSDMPQWVAKLMAFEASVWRKVWDFIRGRK